MASPTKIILSLSDYLNIPESIVTLLLAWSRGGAQVKKTVNGIGHSTTSCC